MKEKFPQQPEDHKPNDPKKGLMGQLGKPSPGAEQGGAANTPAPHGAEEPSWEQMPEVYENYSKRDMKKKDRPINLYANAYQKELDRMQRYWVEVDARAGDTAEEILYRGRRIVEKMRTEEIRVQRLAGLTPEQRERLDLEEAMRALKARRTMSGRINFVQSSIETEQLTKLQRLDPEFIDPIITGLQKRPARLEKAKSALQRVYQPPPEEEEAELRPGDRQAKTVDLIRQMIAKTPGKQPLLEEIAAILDKGKPRP